MVEIPEMLMKDDPHRKFIVTQPGKIREDSIPRQASDPVSFVIEPLIHLS
jgi:hypothetical protein